MKRKTADRADWQRVTQRRFVMAPLADALFTGHITLLCIDAVREPLWVESNGERICIADAGYAWLHQIPHHAQHVVTTMFDASGRIVQWYIDICAQTGVNAQGVPWFDDLYLDVIVSPDGKVGVYDADELDEALAANVITPAQHDLAWQEAQSVMSALKRGQYTPVSLGTLHHRYLLDLM
ncbi:MAG: DUF402 domain-containing protein [Caldilineaceae bacterium]